MNRNPQYKIALGVKPPPVATSERLDLSSQQLFAALVQNLRDANERGQRLEAYLATGKGGAATKTSRQRLRREAIQRITRARIALSEAGEIIRKLRRKMERIQWAEVVG